MIAILIGVILAFGVRLLFPALRVTYLRMALVFSSPEALKEYVLGFGAWAPIVFFLLHLLQVIVAPIPGNLVALAGGALFGLGKGFLLNGLGVIIGSVVAFYLARGMGKPLVIRAVGEAFYARYSKLFSGKYLLGLFIIFLLPFFPDDALCFLAGLSTLPVVVFLALLIIGRLPGVFVSTLTGAGIIKFSAGKWGLIAFFSLMLLFIVVVYGNRITDWLHKKVGID